MKKFSFLLLSVMVIIAAACKKSSDTNDPAPVNCSWTTVFSDDFNHPDGTIGIQYHDTIAPMAGSTGTGQIDIYNNSLRVLSDSVYWAIWYNHEITGNKIRISIDCKWELGSQFNFGVGGRFTSPGKITQTGYFAALMNEHLVIYKVNGSSSGQLATTGFHPEPNHTYKLVFILDGVNYSATITDLGNGTPVTVTATETGSFLKGQFYTINGNSAGGSLTQIFHNFMIERCE